MGNTKDTVNVSKAAKRLQEYSVYWRAFLNDQRIAKDAFITWLIAEVSKDQLCIKPSGSDEIPCRKVKKVNKTITFNEETTVVIWDRNFGMPHLKEEESYCHEVIAKKGKLKDRMKECRFCNYSTTIESKLKQHAKIVHDQIKEYSCDNCSFTTSYLSKMNQHCKRIHGIIPDKQYRCEFCRYYAKRKDDLETHRWRVHNEERSYSCNRCTFITNHKSSLGRHYDIVHQKVRKYKCNLCEYSATRPAYLKIHISKTHYKAIGNLRPKQTKQSINPRLNRR